MERSTRCSPYCLTLWNMSASKSCCFHSWPQPSSQSPRSPRHRKSVLPWFDFFFNLVLWHHYQQQTLTGAPLFHPPLRRPPPQCEAGLWLCRPRRPWPCLRVHPSRRRPWPPCRCCSRHQAHPSTGPTPPSYSPSMKSKLTHPLLMSLLSRKPFQISPCRSMLIFLCPKLTWITWSLTCFTSPTSLPGRPRPLMMNVTLSLLIPQYLLCQLP